MNPNMNFLWEAGVGGPAKTLPPHPRQRDGARYPGRGASPNPPTAP